MTIAYGATGAIAQSGGGGSIDIAIPAGLSAGHILLMPVFPRPSTGVLGSWNLPSGWTKIAQQDEDTGSFGGVVFGKVATGSESTTTVTETSGLPMMGAMLRYTGGTTTLDGTATKIHGAGSDISTPGLTITNDGCLVLFFAVKSWNFPATVSSWPAGATGRISSASSLGANELSLFVGEVIQTSHADIAAGSIVCTDTNSVANSVMVLALRASGGAPSPGGNTPVPLFQGLLNDA